MAVAVGAVIVGALAVQRGPSKELVLRSPPPVTTAGAVASGGSASRAAPSTPGSVEAASSGPSGVAMPVGDLPGWRQTFHEDFSTPSAPSGFPGKAYGRTWTGYEDVSDASGTGHYKTSEITSVHDGELDIHLQSRAGHALLAAPEPMVDGAATGQTYGRYVVRYRSDAVAGFGLAFVLWPDSDDWSDGEVSYPQGPAGGDVSGMLPCPGAPKTTCLSATAPVTSAGWHTATTEWTPTGVTLLLDGTRIAHTATSPTAKMHWVLQTATDGTPAPSASGHVLVDWVAQYSRT